jgi:hypothetical protein
MLLGGGMLSHHTLEAWPVTCNQCSAATTANFKNRPLRCLECDSVDVLPFDDPTLWKGDGKPNVCWGELKLTDGHYRCPKCGKYELNFSEGEILWD